MIAAAWMMYLLLVGTLMTLAARLLASAMRTFGHPTRWVWAGALAAVVVLALFAPRREVYQRALAPSVATRVTAANEVAVSSSFDPLVRLREVYQVVDVGRRQPCSHSRGGCRGRWRSRSSRRGPWPARCCSRCSSR